MARTEIINEIENYFSTFNLGWDDVEGILDGENYGEIFWLTGKAAREYVEESAGWKTLEFYIYLPAHILVMYVFGDYMISSLLIPKNLED